jgi:hypothetical protein
MRVYVSGPITNIADLNRPAFDRAAAELRAAGHEAVNPLDICAAPVSWTDAMRVDIVELVKCDAIAMLPGWLQSKGAQLEHHIAEQLDMQRMYLA